jgi:uncharacterized protein YbaA (DUF1428 family)
MRIGGRAYRELTNSRAGVWVGHGRGNPNVTKFEVPAGEMANFLDLAARANEIHEQHGSVAEVRVWVENLAGPDTGLVSHAKEYPSFEEMAADYSRVHPTPEWQEFLSEFNPSGV